MVVLLCIPSVVQSQTQGYKDFIYQERRDPVTDLNSSIIFTFEIDSPPGHTGQLAWMMSGASVQIYLNAGVFLGHQPVRVTWQFDDGEPVEGSWNPDPEGTAVFLPVGTNNTFTLDAYEAGRVKIMAFDGEGTPHTFTFSLAGLQAAYRAMTGYLVSEDSVFEVAEGFTHSEGAISVRSASSGEQAAGILSWQYREGSIEISIKPGSEIQSESEEIDLLIGFDGGDQYTYQATLSEDRQTAAISGQTAAIITAMSETARMITFSITQPDMQHDFSFDISGLSAALLQIRP